MKLWLITLAVLALCAVHTTIAQDDADVEDFNEEEVEDIPDSSDEPKEELQIPEERVSICSLQNIISMH